VTDKQTDRQTDRLPLAIVRFNIVRRALKSTCSERSVSSNGLSMRQSGQVTHLLVAPAAVNVYDMIVQDGCVCRSVQFSNRLSIFIRSTGRRTRAFSFAGPTVWNSLPDHLRDPPVDSEQFRRDLKTYLFAGYSKRWRIRGVT